MNILTGSRIGLSVLILTAPLIATADDFSQTIKPILQENCGPCHKATGRINFLKAQTAQDLQSDRGLWHNVAAQIRNRTMPQGEAKISEDDRLKVSTWVEAQLQKTACSNGDFAAAAPVRRLNRREYHNTIRDLFGVDFDTVLLFPADGTGGAGFDTNSETLYTPPVLMERYMTAAQQILDRVIITPTAKTLTPQTHVLPAGGEIALPVPIYLDGDYNVQIDIDRIITNAKLSLKVDGTTAGTFRIQGFGVGSRSAPYRPLLSRLQVHLLRGDHTLTIAAGDVGTTLNVVSVDEKAQPAAPEKRALHYRLLGIEPGESPLQPEKAARQTLAAFLPKAFRRPVTASEIDRFMAMYTRAAERGDPYEERMKLAFRAALVYPDFLFRIEQRNPAPGIHPVGQYELANRLSYFLWSTVPDEQLLHLADQNLLQDPKVLTEQVDRMLDDPRSRAFADTFVGQWLGTQDLGGRVAPLLTEIQSYYTPEISADLRAEPVLLFDSLIGENRSLLDLLNANYTFLTERLVKFYQLQGKVNVQGNEFQRVQWPDNRRGGITEMGAVLAMTSHYEMTSPVLRGAWVLESLLGTPVPPPPPNVPPLADSKTHTDLTVRQKLEEHRANPACAACHKLMDPIGFALENFDWMGRWRDKESNGQALDVTGTLPSGEKFTGPVELRQALMNRKDDFIRHLTGKVLGYALGRSLQDGDSCTVQHMVDDLAKDNYRARTLLRDVVLSVPFRNTQGGNLKLETVASAPVRERPKATK